MPLLPHDRHPAAPRSHRLPPFVRAWLGNPRRVGAVAPSGPGLAHAMTRELRPGDGPVIELGPGTGVFTRAILAQGFAPADLALVEASPSFARALHAAFPGVRIIEADAATLTLPVFGEGAAGAVVSGIPILTMNDAGVAALLRFAFTELRPGGGFYQFTYGPRCPIKPRILDAHGLRASRTARILRNAPPAAVYRIERA